MKERPDGSLKSLMIALRGEEGGTEMKIFGISFIYQTLLSGGGV